MKKLLVVGFVLALLASALAGCGGSPKSPAGDGQKSSSGAPAAKQEGKKMISIATASVGGSYYPIGVGMAEVIKKYVPNVDANVVVTGGGAENPKLVGEGENDLGISNSNYIFDAYNGQGGYSKKYTDLRLLFSGVAPGAFQAVVKADSPIKSLGDLRGKRVAVGPQGGGSAPNLAKALEFYGLKLEDVKPSYMGYDDGFTALQNGQVDVALNTAPLPTSGVKSLAASNFKFRLLSMESDKLQALLKKYPYYNPITIPKDMYSLEGDVQIFGTTNMAIVSARLSDDLVYQITKAIFEHLDVVAQAHPSAKSLSLKKAVESPPIPIHPGAEKYYREAGALK